MKKTKDLNKKIKIINIATPKLDTRFQVRLIRSEGIGLLTTLSNESYFILDSIENWYELTQVEYPRKKRCVCKNDYFNVQFRYDLSSKAEEKSSIVIVCTCANCGRLSKPMKREFVFTQIDVLTNAPITYCLQPKIRYKEYEMSGVWDENDLKEFLSFMIVELELNVYCTYLDYSTWQLKTEKVDLEKAIKLCLEQRAMLVVYFSYSNLDYGKIDGMYQWRKDEVLFFLPKYESNNHLFQTYLLFCLQYLEKGVEKDKSEKFVLLINRIKQWLGLNFHKKNDENYYYGKTITLK